MKLSIIWFQVLLVSLTLTTAYGGTRVLAVAVDDHLLLPTVRAPGELTIALPAEQKLCAVQVRWDYPRPKTFEDTPRSDARCSKIPRFSPFSTPACASGVTGRGRGEGEAIELLLTSLRGVGIRARWVEHVFAAGTSRQPLRDAQRRFERLIAFLPGHPPRAGRFPCSSNIKPS